MTCPDLPSSRLTTLVVWLQLPDASSRWKGVRRFSGERVPTWKIGPGFQIMGDVAMDWQKPGTTVVVELTLAPNVQAILMGKHGLADSLICTSGLLV
jgi:hypothetical protein